MAFATLSGQHDKVMTSVIKIIRRSLMAVAFAVFLVCASFGFFPPILLPRWLAPAIHHEKVIREVVKYQAI